MSSDQNRQKDPVEPWILESLLNNTPLMAVLLDSSFNFIWVNRAYAETCRQDQAFFPGKNHFDLYPHEENQAIFQRVVDSGEPFFISEKPFEFPDQPNRGVTWWDWSLIPVKNKASRVTHLVFSLEEVTQRVKADKALCQSEQQHRTILSTALDGFCRIDLQGRILEVNQAYCDITGYSDTELLTMAIRDLESTESPEDTHNRIQKILKRGHDRFESWHRRKDGTLVALDISVHQIKCNEISLVAFLRDITDRKNAETEMLLNQSRLETLLRLNDMSHAGEKDIADFILEKAIQMTTSAIGFLGFMNDDESEMVIHAWSGEIMAQCEIQDKPIRYPIASAGIWAEAVRQRKPLVINDYQAHNLKKQGFPNGHIRLQSLLVIPVIHTGRIVAILATANKPSPYISLDVQQVQLLAEGMWRSIHHRRTGQELARINTFNKNLLDLSPNPIVVINEDTSVRYANRALEKLTGYSAREIVGQKAPYPWWTAKTLDKTHTDLKKAMKNGAISREELFRKKNGDQFWVQISSRVIKENNRFDYYLANWVDITARKKAEAAAEFNEARLDALWKLNQMEKSDRETLISFALDESVRLTQSDIGFVNILSPDEKLVTHAVYTRATREKCGVSPGADAFQISGCGLWSEAFRRRAPVIINDYHAAHACKTGLPQGHIGLERFISIPIFQDNHIAAIVALGNKTAPYDQGDVRQISLLMQGLWQILQQREAWESVRESEKRYHMIADYTYDWETWMGPDNRYRYVSPSCCRITGYEAEDFIRHPELLKEITHPEDREKVQSHFAEEHIDRPATDIDFRIRTPDGEERWLSHCCQTVCDSDGTFLGRRGSTRDITSRKTAEKQLAHTRKMESLGTLAGGIAHEFNNILGGITAYTEVIRDDMAFNHAVCKDLDAILKLSERATGIVRQILFFSRKSGAQKKLHQPAEILQDQLKMLRKIIPATIDIETDLDSDCGPVLGDTAQLQQVVFNLCSNAVDAIRNDDGRILIRLFSEDLDAGAVKKFEDMPPGKYAVFQVSDNGCGIAPEIISRIFDPFFTTKTVGQGTGMGLPAVYGIIRDHNGAISVESEESKGTAVTVILPISTEKPLPENAAAAADINGGTGKILLVDDEEFMVLPQKRYLERLGYSVTTMTSSREALALFKKDPQQYDLVITDLSMPNMSGNRLAAAITAIRPDIPVILATGNMDRIDREKAEAAGVKAFMAKPYQKESLAESIRSVLKKR